MVENQTTKVSCCKWFWGLLLSCASSKILTSQELQSSHTSRFPSFYQAHLTRTRQQHQRFAQRIRLFSSRAFLSSRRDFALRGTKAWRIRQLPNWQTWEAMSPDITKQFNNSLNNSTIPKDSDVYTVPKYPRQSQEYVAKYHEVVSSWPECE